MEILEKYAEQNPNLAATPKKAPSRRAATEQEFASRTVSWTGLRIAARNAALDICVFLPTVTLRFRLDRLRRSRSGGCWFPSK